MVQDIDVDVAELQDALAQARQSVENLTAERDSLVEELDALKKRNIELIDETAETKKLNYTLARQLDARPKPKLEDALIQMYGKGK